VKNILFVNKMITDIDYKFNLLIPIKLIYYFTNIHEINANSLENLL